MPSKLEVTVQKITKVEHHFNADRLDVLEVGGSGGWKVIAGRGAYEKNDEIIYIPTDTLLSPEIMEYLATETKIQMKNERLRAVKIRGVVSEGLSLNPVRWLPEGMRVLGTDVTEHLGLKKRVPRPPRPFKVGKGKNKYYTNTNFKKYVNIERIQKNPTMFSEEDLVVVTKKAHGSNWRCSALKRTELRWWEKAARFLTGWEPREFLVGSHNTVRQRTENVDEVNRLFFEGIRNPSIDVYWQIAIKYQMENLLPLIARRLQMLQGLEEIPNVIVFGEVIGPNIQPGWSYGVPEGEVELRIFDIQVNGVYQDWGKVTDICQYFKLPIVEELYRGMFNLGLYELAEATDVYNGEELIREGAVIKCFFDRVDWRGRAIAKVISPTYLLAQAR